MNNSKIEWTDHTFNPWWGCMKVSAGCKNCYAETLDNRWKGGHWGPDSTRKMQSDKYWQQPLEWDKAAAAAGIPAKVFCASMADWAEGTDTISSPDVYSLVLKSRIRLFTLIYDTPNLIWQLLTKRTHNILPVLMEVANAMPHAAVRQWLYEWIDGKPPANVWIGTSVENQEAANERIPHLLKVPASVRFLSCEPLIGRVDLSRWIGPVHIDSLASECGYFDGRSPENNGYGCNHPEQEEKENGYGKCYDFSCPIACRLEPSEPLDKPIYKTFGLNGDEYDMLIKNDKGIHWVIAGGESGHGARPMHPDWARSLRDQCKAADVPYFFKQHGEWWPGERGRLYREQTIDFTDGQVMVRAGKKAAGRLLDGIEHNAFPNI